MELIKRKGKKEVKFKRIITVLLLLLHFSIFGIKLSKVEELKRLSNYEELKNIEVLTILKSNKDGERKNGIVYENGKEEPFTGMLITRKNGINITGIYFYEKGKLQGDYNNYYENGQLKLKVKKINDKTEGKGVVYHEDGKLEEERVYKNGVVIESTSYRKNGKLWRTLKSTGGLRAIITGYYEDGIHKNSEMSVIQDYSKKGEINYIMDGESIAYDKKGQVLGIINYKDNKTTGLKQQAFKNGKLKYEYISASDKLEDLKMQDYYIEYFDNSEQIKLNCNELSRGNWRCKEYSKNGNFKREFDSPTFRSPNDWSFGINALLGMINILF